VIGGSGGAGGDHGDGAGAAAQLGAAEAGGTQPGGELAGGPGGPALVLDQHHEVEQGDRGRAALLVEHPFVDQQGAAGGEQAGRAGHDRPAALGRVVVEDVGQQDRVPALAGRAAEVGQVEVPGHEGQLGVALAQDRLDRRQVEDGGLQAGHGPGQGGGVGAGAAAHLQQPARPLEGGQAGQLAREPGGQVVQGAQEVEGAAGVGGQPPAPGRA
jgi:hypothetical protein